MKDVEPGTGRIENVLPAQITGSSTTPDTVFQFQTNAKLSTSQEPVFHATKDIILKMELAFLPLSKDHLMLDVVSGIGTRESA